jgi:hypothetical protein
VIQQTPTGLEQLPVFYNISCSVGRNAVNNRVDVMMVQYLLREIYSNSNAFNPPVTPPKGEMKVDGICGPITLDWILETQKQLRARGSSVMVDGKVDRATHGFIGSISHTIYTIIHLNASLQKARPDAFPRLEATGDVPPLLRSSIVRI